LAFKTHGLPGNNLATFAGFNLTVNLHQTISNNDLGLGTAFAPALELKQIAQLNVRMFS